MVSPRKLLILGAVIGFFTLALGSPTAPPSRPRRKYERCLDRAIVQRRKFFKCVHDDFTEDEVAFTGMVLYPDTNCVGCKHFCRKLAVVHRCIKKVTNVLQTFSNKSQEMVPFVTTLVEESLQALCEDDGKLINAFINDDNLGYFRWTWYVCNDILDGAEYFYEAVACEIPNDRFTKQFICQKYLEFFECAQKTFGVTSRERNNAVANVTSKWRSEAFCGKYLNNIENSLPNSMENSLPNAITDRHIFSSQ